MITLKELYDRSLEDEKFLLPKMSIPEERPFFIQSLLWVNDAYMLNALFVKGDIDNAKNAFYQMALINAYCFKVLRQDVYEVVSNFAYPLLSDNKNLILDYAHYSPISVSNSFAESCGRAIQAVLNDDDALLSLSVDHLKATSKKGWASSFSDIITVFEGFLNRDASIIQNGVERFLAKHEKQHRSNQVRSQFINIEATMLLKLALIKGYSIFIKNDLVPELLLPLNELESYRHYEFLSEVAPDNSKP